MLTQALVASGESKLADRGTETLEVIAELAHTLVAELVDSTNKLVSEHPGEIQV
jgi:hypothetical protein